MSGFAESVAEELTGKVQLGREAGFVLRAVGSRVVEMTTKIMENAVAAERSGELTGERALRAWGKISALWGLQEQLEDEMTVGEAAARDLNTQQPPA